MAILFHQNASAVVAFIPHRRSWFRTLLWILAISFCLLAVPGHTLGQGGRIDISVDEHMLSADIREARLGDVISRIKDELGIWVEGTRHVTDETVSVEFESVPLERGLDRILSSADYSLIFDGRGDIVGLILISSTSATGVRRPQPRVRPRTVPNVSRRTLPRSRR